MKPTKMNVLGAAIRVGEESTDLAIKRSLKILLLRKLIWRGLNQLKQGRPDQARKTLEEALRE